MRRLPDAGPEPQAFTTGMPLLRREQADEELQQPSAGSM